MNILKGFLTTERILSIVLVTLGIAILLINFYPIVFQNYTTGGADVVGSAGESHQISQWSKKTGERAMWNPSIFGGMPTYHRLSSTTWGFDTLVGHISNILFSSPLRNLVGYYIVGLIGCFLLFRQFKFSQYVSIFASFAYTMSIHWVILLDAGHFAKFRPIMLIPIVLWAFLRMAQKKDLLSTGLFIFLLSAQIRTLHFQIIFYMALFLLFIGLWTLYEQVKVGENWKKFLILTVVALSLNFGIVSQNLMMTSEYAKTTMRGGNGAKEGSGIKKTTGLSYNYATSWSFDPKEMGEFIIPRFSGGGNSETYNGGSPKFKQYIDQKVPGYHGTQPIRGGSADYLGIVTVFFAIIGLILNWKNRFIRVLFGFSVLSLFIAFGRHFSLIYDLFYNYMPYFNKFRIPSMILVMLQMISVIFAAFGLNSIITSSNKKELLKPVFVSGGILIGISLICFIFSGSFNYLSERELSAAANQKSALIALRKDLFIGDVQRLLFFSISLVITSFLYINNVIKENWKYCTVIFIILLVDLLPMHRRYMLGKKPTGQYHLLSRQSKSKSTLLKKSKADEFLLSQRRKDLEFAEYRIYPVAQNVWNTNDYSYYHQSIGGYSAQKMRIQQDLFDLGRHQNSWVFNRKIPDMLNAKYFVVDATLPNSPPFENLELVHTDGKRNTYLNKNALGKAWFVDSIETIVGKENIFSRIKSDTFDLRKSAIINVSADISVKAANNDSVHVLKNNPHLLELYVENDNQSFLVISDAYYDKGWTAKVAEKETKIYQTNHVLRGIVIPAGKHEIKMTFMPNSVKAGSAVGFWSTSLSILILLYGMYIIFKEKNNLTA